MRRPLEVVNQPTLCGIEKGEPRSWRSERAANTTGAPLSERDLPAGRAVRGFGLSCGRVSSAAPDRVGHKSARGCARAGCLPSLQGSHYSAAPSFQTGVSGGCFRDRSGTSETRSHRLHLASSRS
jgi:hypothetical protein